MTSPYYYDKRVAEAAVEFFPRFLRHMKGDLAGKPLELSAFHAHHTAQIFGWRKRSNGKRRYRRVRKWVPRKNAKTIWGAGLGHITCIGDGEPGAEVYSWANNAEQARICYDMGAQMTAMSLELSNLYEVTKTGMLCPHLMSSWRVLSGEASGKHGLNAHAAIGDEVHEARDGRLHTFIRQSMGARSQPLDVTISTAGLRETYGYELYEESVKIRDGILDDPEAYVIICEADEKDDWTHPDTWAKANPLIDIVPNLRDYLAAECKKAQSSPRLENDFKRYHLNMWVSQAVRWLPMDHWRQCSAAPLDRMKWKEIEAKLKGRRCYGGIDLASTSDTCSEVLIFPPEDGMPLTVLPRFWVPESAVEKAVNVARLPYDRWVREGALIVTPGNVTDYGFIRDQVLRDCEMFQVVKLGFDPYNGPHLMQELMADGVPAEKVLQNFLVLSPAAKELERLVLKHELDHGNHPVLEHHADNVAVIRDPQENIKPVKNKSTGKIDGIAALVTALAIYMSGQQPVPVSPYDDPNFSVVA